MKHIVSIGGGFSSTIELPIEVLRKYPSEDVIMVIACLKGEHPDLWRLVREAESMFGMEILRIAYDGHRYTINAPESDWWDIWQVFEKEGRMGSSLADPCSKKLKREVIWRFVQDRFPRGEATIHVGITGHEIDRMMAVKSNWRKRGYKAVADLAGLNLVGTSGERCQALLGWQPALYRWAEHNNCDGFCVKAGHKHMAMLLWYQPDVFYYHADKERAFQIRHNTTATIMRDRKTVHKQVEEPVAATVLEGAFPGFSDVPVIGSRSLMKSVIETTPLTIHDFAERMLAKWSSLLPGQDPFTGLEATPACRFCEAAG